MKLLTSNIGLYGVQIYFKSALRRWWFFFFINSEANSGYDNLNYLIVET